MNGRLCTLIINQSPGGATKKTGPTAAIVYCNGVT